MPPVICGAWERKRWILSVSNWRIVDAAAAGEICSDERENFGVRRRERLVFCDAVGS